MCDTYDFYHPGANPCAWYVCFSKIFVRSLYLRSMRTVASTNKSVFLKAEWRRLAIANYSIDPAVLKPYIPYGTELDFWKGKCYVSLVGFRFLDTRIRGVRVPFHINFEEINLRFYVRYNDNGVWKRGVTFIKEIVPKPALTLVANTIYNEKYVTLPTKHIWIDDPDYIKVAYEWKHGGTWDRLSVTADPAAFEMLPGSEEEFITEHYWGYTQRDDKQTSQYQVDHPKWEVYPVNEYVVNVRFGELYGNAFGILNNAIPDSVMLAEGSPVSVFMHDRIRQ